MEGKAKPAVQKRRRVARSVVDPITLYPAWCKKCGICIGFCPKSVFDTAPDGAPMVARPEDCVLCQMCELRCPDFAISVCTEEKAS